MKILLDNSPKQILEKSRLHDFTMWQLRTPLTSYRLAGHVPYGLDNGCFSGNLPKSWGRLVSEAFEARPLFVAMPDVVGSARRTSDLFDFFERRTNGLPRALVLQDGIADIRIPWSQIEAVFIGGSDSFKISPEAIQAARCAKMLGKWVHVGRVNDPSRVMSWIDLADSIDGSGISRFDHMLGRVVSAIKNGERNEQLDLDVGAA